MGRVTEYVDFINRKPIPDKDRIKFLYTHLGINDRLKLIRKEHLKNLKEKEKFLKALELF